MVKRLYPAALHLRSSWDLWSWGPWSLSRDTRASFKYSYKCRRRDALVAKALTSWLKVSPFGWLLAEGFWLGAVRRPTWMAEVQITQEQLSAC